MSSPSKRIATNLITGVLGSGKTTAIQSLLDQKPVEEQWAVVINEYGQVAIDNVLLEHSDEIQVMELANGCVCCTMSHEFEPLLEQLIRKVNPDRLIIEPSGAGHPARIIDMLRSEGFGKLLDLRATLCMVDPADYANPRIANSSLFNDQLAMSDCVVISWTDKRSSEVVQRCRENIAALDPPKLMVFETAHGRLDPRWLDTPIDSPVQLKYDPAHTPPVASEVGVPVTPAIQLSQSKQSATTVGIEIPSTNVRHRRFENHGNGQWACGWIFPSHIVFDRDKIVDLVEGVSPVLRAKGIFHCQDDWWAINRKSVESSLQPSSYRSDSRLEIIAERPLDWNEIELQLLATRV
jgi:G3E family GTPase